MQKQNLEKFKTLTCIGLIVSLLLFILGCAIITLTAIEFRYIYANWSDKPYTALGPTQLAVGCVIVITACIGFYVFGFDPKVGHCYGIILIISMLFSFAIGIFATVGAAMKGKVNKAIGCDEESTGLLTIWDNIDEYFILAHSLVCSPLCPCTMTYETAAKFNEHRFAHSYLDTMVENADYFRTSDKKSKFNIDYCDRSAQHQIFKMYESNPNNTMTDLNYRKFKKYFKKIEENFECSGWCTTSYTNAFTLKKQKMYKYIFSDINKGVVKYPGCLNRVLYFVYVFTSICASFLLFCGALLLVNLIILMGVVKLDQELSSKVKTDEYGRELHEKPEGNAE